MCKISKLWSSFCNKDKQQTKADPSYYSSINEPAMQKASQAVSTMCASSITNKSENQDAFICLRNQYGNVFVVADGIGSFKQPQKASEFAIAYIKEHLDAIVPERTRLISLFKKIGEELRLLAQSKYGNTDIENLFGTTLIIGIETADKLFFSYLGNGAILHIRGTITQFNLNDDAWYINNLLSPHTVAQNGREALYNHLSNNDIPGEHTPTIIEVSKDEKYGDIFVICTDGIFSADHVVQYSSPKIGLLYKYDTNLLALKKHLFELINLRQFTEQALMNMTSSYLTECKPSLTDDSTLAILITDQFINNIHLHSK